MSNVAIFKSGELPQYLRSVNTPDYEDDPDVLINPDITGVQSVLLKYWKRVGDVIEEMNITEKQVVEDAELQERKATANNFGVGVRLAIEGLIVAGNNRWSKGQEITKQEVVNWLKGQIN